MVDQRDYYEVLGVGRRASSTEITAAYRKLAVRFHPDKNPGDSEAASRFKEAARAFEVLSDDDLRSRYDRFGHAGVEGGRRHDFNDISDVFEAFGDLFGGSIFGDAFGGGRQRGSRARKGRDVFCQVHLSLVEAARGVTKTVEFDRHETCGECDGSGARKGTAPQPCDYCGGRGQVIQSAGVFRLQTTCPACRGAGSVVKERCPACGGEGVTEEHVSRKVTIPAGVDRDVRVRLAGEGEPGAAGGPPGDCYCVIEIEDHPFLARDGKDLHCEVPVSFTQAALGATVDVPTLDGPKPLEIARGTQPGDVIRVRGLGMPEVRGRGVGDLHVHVHVEVPRNVSGRAEELLRELAAEEHASVSPKRTSFFTKLAEYFQGKETAGEQPQHGSDQEEET
ncbi:MAG: molecular chaperone DnaJ [Planctomycetota bacterium]|jgi:molecular chaperone DnaJ|nr:molecular chaperone DnaJ [Planctomycetota bacterium]MDA1201608.1 molecular chaperone DnaJ [Planctomycetota bacterium]